ncbi:MAG: CopG family transcriptional regulator [Oscillochloridaceae bacterium]|nr:ribbon-helix-helix domain-containing protein [Chloroflexaceae bacterium]MDW8389034.1 CopG family transcriptional regulator [Oscillochloridaceae bacterium]
MATTTIRVSKETRDLLNQLARAAGTSIQQVLETALEQYRRRQFLESLNVAYAALQADPQAQAEAAAEAALWDVTLLDGLDQEEEGDGS